MIRQKNQPIAVLVLFALALSPITLGSVCFAYPTTPFGGGGGDGWSHVVRGYAYLPACGAWCGGFVAYVIGKAMDYVMDHWSDPSGCSGSSCVGNASMNQGGALGGGGGEAF